MSVETADYLGMVRRVLRAAARRVGEADEFELAELAALRGDLDEAIAQAVAGQRAGAARGPGSVTPSGSPGRPRNSATVMLRETFAYA